MNNRIISKDNIERDLIVFGVSGCWLLLVVFVLEQQHIKKKNLYFATLSLHSLISSIKKSTNCSISGTSPLSVTKEKPKVPLKVKKMH